VDDLKVLYFDTETTGTNVRMHDVWQFAAIAEINRQPVESVIFEFQPFNWDYVSPEALEIHGRNTEYLRGLQTPRQGYNQIRKFLEKYIKKFNKKDKFIACGYNIDFDMQFMKAFFEKNGDQFFGSWVQMNSNTYWDVLHLVRLLWRRGFIPTENCKLETICNYFGIPINAHDAFSDICASRELWYILDSAIGLLRPMEELIRATTPNPPAA
jgi:DNA polymerase III epsilon subunit-like protein